MSEIKPWQSVPKKSTTFVPRWEFEQVVKAEIDDLRAADAKV